MSRTAWRLARVGDVGEYINGLAFKPSDWGTQGRPIIRIQNLTDDSRPYNYTRRAVDDRFVVRDRDILVSWSATLDAFLWRGPEAVLNQHIFKVVPNGDLVSHGFLYYQLKHVIGEMWRSEHTHGSTMKHINRGPFLAHPFWVPSADHQRAIVESIETHFSRLDAAVASLNRTKANVKRARASVLQAAVEGRLVPTEAELARAEGREYEPASALPGRLENGTSASSVSEDLQEGWALTTMKVVAEVSGGITKNAGRGQRPLSVPYLRVANVYADELRLDDVSTIAVGPTELQRFLLQRDDLLIVEGNGSPEQLGRVATWTGAIKDCIHQNHLIKARPKAGIAPRWLLHWLLSPGGRQAIQSSASSTSGLHTLSIRKVEALPVPLPPLAEQLRIVSEVDRRLSVLDALDSTIDANIARCARLRQAILQRAFEGRLVVPEGGVGAARKARESRVGEPAA